MPLTHPPNEDGLTNRAPSPRRHETPGADRPPGPDAAPKTLSLLGRLFGVPFVIGAILLAGAVFVVVAFGVPAASQPRSLDDLLTALESGTGERSMGMLLGAQKEHWQTGLELVTQLQRKRQDCSDAELEDTATRLAAMIEKELMLRDRSSGSDPSTRFRRATRSPDRAPQLEFLIRALGLTRSPAAVKPLIDVVRTGGESYAIVAMEQLGNLGALPESRAAVAPLITALETANRSETRVMACTVLSVLADPSDGRVLGALASARLTGHGEVAWSAALALARLGSDEGKTTLLDLLDRTFWESERRYRTEDSSGRILKYRMPPDRVERYLQAAIDAASNLNDVEIWRMIEQLKFDPSPSVRGKATDTLQGRSHPSDTEDRATES